MSADVVNLRQARKRKARAAAERQAAENRAAHGRSKAERVTTADARARRDKTLDGARRDDDAAE